MAINTIVIEAIIIDVLTRAAALFVDKARTHAPPHLRNHFSVGTVEKEGTTFSIEIINAHMSAQWFEEGVTPHTIEARNASVLKFVWEDAPAEVRETQPLFPVVFFKRVTHPGIPAYAYMEKAYNETIVEVDKMLEDAFEGVVLEDA